MVVCYFAIPTFLNNVKLHVEHINMVKDRLYFGNTKMNSLLSRFKNLKKFLNVVI